MQQRCRWALFALFILIQVPSPSQALSTLVFTASPVDGNRPGGVQGRVYAGADAVLTIAGHEDQSVADAYEVARRLNVLAEAGGKPQDLAIRKDGKSYVISARGQSLVTIDRAMAKAHATDPATLAKTWLDNLAAQFGRPYLSADPIVVPVGETRAIPVRGNVVGKLTTQTDGAVAEGSYDYTAHAIRIRGLSPGSSEVILSDGTNVLRVPIRAAKYAGRISRNLRASVTGTPAPADVIRRAATAAVVSNLSLEPGAWASIDAEDASVTAAGLGRTRQLPVKVSVAGEDYLRYQADTTVTVTNEPVQNLPAEILMVSNEPERLLAHGLWYEGALNELSKARLLYHHVNNSGVPSDFIVELWNVGEQPTRVQVISGKGGPSNDEAYSGHRAAEEFLARREENAGWIVTLPAKTAVPVLTQKMGVGTTLSGIMELRRLEPGDVRVRCYLEESRSIWLPYRLDSYDSSPVLGRWAFPDPRRQIEARYVVGREWAFVTLGSAAADGTTNGDKLDGNYGVIYDIDFELVNPYEQPATVEVRMEAGGGAALAALRVNGRPVSVSMLRRNEEPTVARYVLAPGETRTVSIETLPQGGSNYPVRIFARMM